MTRILGVAAGAVGVAALLTGCGLTGGILDEDTASYDVTDKVAAISIATDSGQIEVTESARDDIRVTEHRRWRGDKPVTSHETRGDTLVLAFTCPRRLVSVSCDVAYDVEIPRGLRVKAVSDSGAVTLRDLSGDVDASSDSGAIEAGGLAGKKVLARTDSGAITLAFTDRPDKVETVTDSGGTEVRVPGGPYAVKATTDSGAENITTPQDASAPRSITLTSDSGSITVTGS